MPIYTFRCKSCDLVKDKLLPFAAINQPQKCPACGEDMTRQVTAPSFRVMGYNAQNGYSRKN